MSLKSRGRDESLIICEMKQYIYTYYRSFLHWLVLLSLSQISSPHHGVPHDHSVHLRHELTYRSEKNFVWFICTDHDPAPKITSHGGAWWRQTDRQNKHFESSQKLRKDGIGILENFIENMLSNYILTLYLITVVLCFVLVNCTC